jgi:hypothetical protein
VQLTFELVRIALRYLGMFLIAKGVFDPQTADSVFSDPALVEIVVGVVSAAVAEIGYAVSKWRVAKEVEK